MQVSGVYIDIKIIGSNKTNILTYENMRVLQITETAGTSLPYVWLRFYTFEDNLADYFQQNNTIELTIGSSPEDCETFNVSVIDGTKDQDPSGSGWIIDLAGFIGPNYYMMDKSSEAYTGNSLLVAKQVVKECFGKDIISDITETKENQVTWRRTQETLCYFLVNTLLHMDIRPSFPLFSFDKYGNFYLKSYSDVIEQTPKFTFTSQPTEK